MTGDGRARRAVRRGCARRVAEAAPGAGPARSVTLKGDEAAIVACLLDGGAVRHDMAFVEAEGRWIKEHTMSGAVVDGGKVRRMVKAGIIVPRTIGERSVAYDLTDAARRKLFDGTLRIERRTGR